MGRVQVYTGDGKGKTTAAVGLALRALGAGKQVFLGQFIKGQLSSEMKALREHSAACSVECFGLGRFVRGELSPEDIEAAQRGLRRLNEILTAGKHELVIADEINGAVQAGLISVEEQLNLIDKRPEHVELVMTGRHADSRLIDRADLVTEMRKIKHYFDKGIPAREGMEY